MSKFTPRNPDFAARVQRSFENQGFMAHLGAKLSSVEAGFVEIELPFKAELRQQHGFFHGGVVGSLADNCGGYAAYTLLRAQDSVVTVEYKLNIMAPAAGDTLMAQGRVVRAGRQLFVTQADVFSRKDGRDIHCATMLGTFMTLIDTPEIG